MDEISRERWRLGGWYISRLTTLSLLYVAFPPAFILAGPDIESQLLHSPGWNLILPDTADTTLLDAAFPDDSTLQSPGALWALPACCSVLSFLVPDCTVASLRAGTKPIFTVVSQWLSRLGLGQWMVEQTLKDTKIKGHCYRLGELYFYV